MTSYRNDDRSGERTPDSGKTTQTAALFEIAKGATLFHTPDEEAYADFPKDGHTETYPVRSRQFKDYLLDEYLDRFGRIPSKNSLEEALTAAETWARRRGPMQEVYLRVAWQRHTLYLDLCNAEREVVKMTRQGWEIIRSEQVPVRFRRTKEMLARPLPRPERGGSLNQLFDFLNVPEESDRILVMAFLLGTLHPNGPYAGLALYGEQGSAKSSAARYIRSIVDPSSALLTEDPKDAETLALQAHANRVPVFDNLRSVRDWQADALCRLATGNAFNKRTLYENTDLTVIKVKRPFIVTSIADAVTQPDLLNRLLIVRLPTISESGRKDERAMDAEFAKAHPFILGALLDAVVAALSNWNSVTLPQVPRMADLALWVTAAEEALGWKSGTFVATYSDNQVDAYTAAIDSNPVAQMVVKLLSEEPRYHGTPKELHDCLSALADNGYGKKPTGWPTNAKVMSDRLKMAAPALRTREGISVEWGKSGDRYITLERVDQAPNEGGLDKETPTVDSGRTGRREYISVSFREKEERGEKETKPSNVRPLRPDAEYAEYLADMEDDELAAYANLIDQRPLPRATRRLTLDENNQPVWVEVPVANEAEDDLPF